MLAAAVSRFRNSQIGKSAVAILVLMAVGCDDKPLSAPGAAGAGSSMSGPAGAAQPSASGIPESLKSLIAELDGLAKQKTIPAGVFPPMILLPTSGQAYAITDGKLTYIDIAFTPVTDEFLTKLKDFPDLIAINLTGTQITDEGLQNLGAQPALKDLYLEMTKVTAAGAASFHDSHPNCKVSAPK